MKNRAGFSLFEIIVYLAIFSVVIVSVLTIVTRSLASKTKAQSIQEVEYVTQYVMQRITSDVHSASDIDETNFTGNVLTLTMPDGSEIEYTRTSNTITIERDGGGTVDLTSGNVSIDDFTLENNTSFGSEYKDITVTVGASTTSASGRREYDADFELTSTISLRQ